MNSILMSVNYIQYNYLISKIISQPCLGVNINWFQNNEHRILIKDIQNIVEYNSSFPKGLNIRFYV